MAATRIKRRNQYKRGAFWTERPYRLPLWKNMDFVSWDDDMPNMNGNNNPNVPNHQPETPLTQDFPAMFDDIRVYCQKIPCYNIISLMIFKPTSSINNSHYDPIVVIGSTSPLFYLLMDECNPIIISSINDHYIPIQTKTIVYWPNADIFFTSTIGNYSTY